MYTRTPTLRSTDGCSEQIKRLSEEIRRADAIVVGAGAGLSVSAGFVYTGERFRRYFSDFAEKYGFRDMYSGGFYPYETPEEYWAYWSRYLYINRYLPAAEAVYERLLEIVGDREYFVLTTNVDHQFQNAGFDRKRLFYTQGDYGLFQCSIPCSNHTYDNEEAVRRMVEQQKEMRIPASLVPFCPVCGEPMSMNLRIDNTFVEDEGWHLASERYRDFLQLHRNKRVLFLELGTGYNTPGIIKYEFWRMVNQWPDAVYACINLGEAFAPDHIRGKSICINEDIGMVLKEISINL